MQKEKEATIEAGSCDDELLKNDEDEITIAKSIFDEIVEESEKDEPISRQTEERALAEEVAFRKAPPFSRRCLRRR
jgi:hypothetical protein